MSTKINVRSPFYLHITEPTVPLPLFTCGVAFPNGLDNSGFSVDDQGIITEPNPDFGQFISLTSSAGDFANAKFAPVSSDTNRTVTATIRIPTGFSNTSDVHKTCDLTAIQPGTSSSVVQPTVCSGGPTLNGSISAVALDSGGNSTTINLATKFNNATVYAVSNSNPTLVTTSISGTNLIITSNAIGGTVTIYAIGRDANYPTTCEALQPISITISLPAGSPNFDCNTSPLTGGGIATNGVITRPSTTGNILGVSLSQGGSLLNPETVSANTGANAQNVQLFFKISAPTGYPNAGQNLSSYCDITYSQAGTALEDFSCDRAGLTLQSINDNGTINKGKANEGSIVDFSPISFDPVTSDTSRTVAFTVQIPNGYNNAGSNLPSPCNLSLLQPAAVNDCPGTNGYFISSAKQLPGDFCDGTFGCTTQIISVASSIPNLLGKKVCQNGVPFNGKSLRYAVSLFSTASGAGVGVGDFFIIMIDGNGTVLSVDISNCDSGGDGSQSQLL